MSNLNKLALFLVGSPRGILAADESTKTMNLRLEVNGLQGSNENRKAWRDLIFSTKGMSDFVSGIIMYKETLMEVVNSNRILDMLSSSGIVIGVKVDEGLGQIPTSPKESYTTGIEGIKNRLKLYRQLGVKFTKWRSIYKISENFPSEESIKINSKLLGIYASIAQQEDLVPIVEPEVLIEGNHSIEKCFSVTDRILSNVFQELELQNVKFDSIILKPNMVTSGNEALEKANSKEIALNTLKCLEKNLPNELPGVAFLSGGQSDQQATTNLYNIVNNSQKFSLHCDLTYSFGRAILSSSLNIWEGKSENISIAQSMIIERLKANSNARLGILHS